MYRQLRIWMVLWLLLWSLLSPCQPTMVLGIIGDSISTPAYGTVAALLAALATANPGTRFAAVDMAVSGTSTSDWLPGTHAYAAAVRAFQAGGVVGISIMLGTNDARRAVRHSAATYQTNLRAIVADLRRHGWQVWVQTPPYSVPGANDGDQDVRANQLKAAYARLRDLPRGDTRALSYFAQHPSLLVDGIHPTVVGARVLGQFWATALQPRIPCLSH